MAQSVTMVDVNGEVDEFGVLLLRPEIESVPEDDRHMRLVNTIYSGVAGHFADVEDVAVFSRIAWFPDADDTSIRLDPDVMVVFGRPSDLDRRSYRAWAEEGVQPRIIIEVVSSRDPEDGYAERLARARRYGALEVVLVNPFAVGGALVRHLVVDETDPTAFRLATISASSDQPIHVDSLGVRFAGGRHVRVFDDNGTWIDAAKIQTVLWETEARAARLAAALREMGVDPDEV